MSKKKAKVKIVLPPRSNDKISSDLCDLTKILHESGADISRGFLGGEFGYGAYFENDVFEMHPYCWCEKEDCRWCGDERAANFLHKKSGSTVHWYKYIGRSMETEIKGDWRRIFQECLDSIKPAPPAGE